jgi:hypothetical protein
MRSSYRIKPRLPAFASPSIGTVVLLLVIAVAGCGPTATAVRVLGPLPLGADRAIFVTAARQKKEIVRALRGAGFDVADRVADGSSLLRVTLGVEQGSRPCGTLNNVRYQLRVQGRDVIVAEAKGWTGSCEPNVFDEVSREIKRRMAEMKTQERQGQ